jgi:phosphate transport system substrate-binding protein
MKLSRSMKIAVLATSAALLAASPAFAGVSLTGSGSTFAQPLIDTCKIAWQSATGNTLTYSGGGSGTGRKNADNGVNDFNFSDATYNAAKPSIVHIPVIAAPIAVLYNLRISKQLYLSPKTIADIFAGVVTKWNDGEIVADNNGSSTTIIFKKDAKGNVLKDKTGKPIVRSTQKVSRHVTFPNHKINVIFRADGSGTTQNFVNLLINKAPSVWNKTSNSTFANVFPGDINAPTNLGRYQSASGSAGVTALAGKTAFSITYAEASYAKSAGLGAAAIKNVAGNYQTPDSGGTAAFLSAATIATDGKMTFNYATTDPAAYLYGIVTYALVDTAVTGAPAIAVKSFLNYLLDPKCPSTNPDLQYTTLTGSVLAADQKLIAKIQG